MASVISSGWPWALYSLDDLEAVFHEQIKHFLFSDDEIATQLEKADGTIKEKAELLAVLEKEATKLATEIDKLYDLYQSGMIDKSGFGTKYKPLSERRDQLENQIPETQAEIDVLKISHLSQETAIAEARDLHSRWPTLPFEEKRRIVETITEKITIGDGEVEINLYYAPPPPKRSGGGSNTSGQTGGGSASPASLGGNRGNLATPPHGFIAATNWKRAGNSACLAARETMMRPDSSGSRSTSRTLRANSGSSSRNNTPCIAIEISPGRGLLPPPTSATPDAV